MWTTQSFVAQSRTRRRRHRCSPAWAAAGPWCCFPFTKKLRRGGHLSQVYVSTSETNRGRGAGQCGLGARAGARQHGTSGPGVLAQQCQHSKIRSAVSAYPRCCVDLSRLGSWLGPAHSTWVTWDKLGSGMPAALERRRPQFTAHNSVRPFENGLRSLGSSATRP